jgi:hypothetical protein
LKLPKHTTEAVSDMLHLLLDKNAVRRLTNCTVAAEGASVTVIESTNADHDRKAEVTAGKNVKAAQKLCSTLSYDCLRRHDIFKPLMHRLQTDGIVSSSPDAPSQSVQLSRLHSSPALRVPTLSEMCIRAVGAAAVNVSEATALNGGFRPDTPWMQVTINFSHESCKGAL